MSENDKPSTSSSSSTRSRKHCRLRLQSARPSIPYVRPTGPVIGITNSNNSKSSSSSSSANVPQNSPPQFNVEAIVGDRINDRSGIKEYHIKWSGYPDGANTWEPETNLGGCTKLLNAYLSTHQQNDAPNTSKQQFGQSPNSKRKHFVLKTVEVPPKKQKSNKNRKPLHTVVAIDIDSNDRDDAADVEDHTKKHSKTNNDMSKTPKRQGKQTPSYNNNNKKSTPKPMPTPSTSALPPNTKPRVVKDNTFQQYTLVRGLHSMIRPEKRDELKQAIQNVVVSVSKSLILGSRHAHVRIMEVVQRAMEEEERKRIEREQKLEDEIKKKEADGQCTAETEEERILREQQEENDRAEHQIDLRNEFTPQAVQGARGQMLQRGYIVEKDFNPTKRTKNVPLIHNDEIHQNFKRYMDFYNVEIPILPAGGPRCHEYARTQFYTCFRNNIRVHAYDRIRKFFYTNYDKIKNIRVRSKLQKSIRKRLINSTLKYLFYVEPKKKKQNPDPLPIPDEDLLKSYRNVLRPLLPEGVTRMPLGWLGKTLRDKIDWYRHVHEFIRLQLWIYDENIGRDEMKQIKLFTVIPQYHFKQHFMTIDTIALGRIANSFEHEQYKRDKIQTNNIAIRMEMWQKYFYIDRLNKQQRYFDFSIKTDGVAVHFVMRNKNKTKSKRQILDINGDELEPEITGYIDDRITREITDDIREKYTNGRYESIIGYDPGYKLPVAVVRKNILTGHESSYTMHWKEFRKLCGDNERKERRYRIAGKHERRHRKLRENRDIYPEQPSNKSPLIWTYIDYQFLSFHRCCKVYMRRSMARMNFDAYICTQQALQKIAKIITEQEEHQRIIPNNLFAVGDFKFSANSPIRGSVRCPMRSLFNLLAQQYGDVVEIDEHLTSKICSICGSKMIKKGTGKDRYFICKNNMPADVILPRPHQWTTGDKLFIGNPDFQATSINNYGKRVAVHGSIVWNRDINAPRNMIYKLMCMLDGEEISPVFNRPPQHLDRNNANNANNNANQNNAND